MLTYDPDASTLLTDIPETREEMPLNEELAREALKRDPQASQNSVPTGLLKNYSQEKKIDESQMADFSTPIEELMQNDIMMAPGGPSASRPQPRSQEGSGAPQEQRKKKSAASGNPLGLTDEQFQAALAGLASVVAFSHPVQSRLRTMVPKFVGESGEVSLTGLGVTALVAALVFYIIKKYLVDKA
jgi:hypothetical protein